MCSSDLLLKDEDLSLEESVENFKLASELYKQCEKLLTEAEGQIKIIMEDDIEEDFSLEV